jgi:phage shock protein A
MSNLLNRIKNAIAADLNEVLDQKEKKNPIALLNEYLRQSEQETEKVRKLIERQNSLKEEFACEYHKAMEMAEKRKHQAEVASQAGENELHQFAIEEQLHFEERAVRLKESLNQATDQLNSLERKYEEMKHKLKDMQIRRMELMGRENATRANYRINQVIDNDPYSNKAYSRFQEIEGYLDRLENQVNTSYNRNTFDARIAQLEKDMKKEAGL